MNTENELGAPPGEQEKLEHANLFAFIRELDLTIAATAEQTPDAPFQRTALTKVFQERITEIGEAKKPVGSICELFNGSVQGRMRWVRDR